MKQQPLSLQTVEAVHTHTHTHTHTSSLIEKRKNEKLWNHSQSGITLVALVVTIVVLLILAGITISYIIGDNSIFQKASDAKLQTEIAQWQERLELAKNPVIVDGLGSLDSDKYFEYIEKQGIIEDKERDVLDKGDGTYEVTTKPGHVFEIQLVPSKENPKDIEIEYVGEAKRLLPQIKSIVVTSKSSNSIAVEVTVSGLNDGKLSYYYKTEDEGKYHELEGKQNTTDLTAEFTGLEQNKIYNIKVVVENKNGSNELVVNEITGDLKVGSISQKGETIWTNGKASIELETTPSGLRLEYQVNGIEGTWLPYTGAIGNLNHGDSVYARITDGTNAGDVATIEIRDNINPIDATIELGATTANTGVNVTAKVTHNDAQSGVKMASCKWVYNTTSTKIGTTASSYTGGTFTTNGQTINLNTSTPGIYYLHVLTTDNAGNVWETISESVTVNQLATGITVSPTTATVFKGETKQLTATVSPTNTNNKAVTWTSSNTTTATVSSSGLVTAKTEGTATITVKTNDGSNKSATCTITVKVKEPTVGDIVGQPQTSNKIVKDENGNKITIPGGFKVVPNSPEGTDESIKVDYTYNGDGTPAVQDGIVIEDGEGNQFVWIPVGDIKNKDGSTTTITLGRYTFNSINGTPTLQQNADNYTEVVTIPNYYQELNSNSGNTAAKNLGDFITKAKVNGGYYLGRYEASKGSDNKVKSQADKAAWTDITQADAATQAREMYSSNYVESDLSNSYSWDTAIVFIQKYSGNSNYANKKSVNTSKLNTGKAGDKVCNIHDMASNCYEWSTEHSTRAGSNYRYPCVSRGGLCYNSSSTTSYRNSDGTTLSSTSYSFRPLFYVK